MTVKRIPLIAGNWKMHKLVAESENLARDIINGKRRSDVEVMVAPPFTSLLAVARLVDTSDVALGAQNMHWKDQGAFTGEISPTMLTDLGVNYVIIGHSERRHLFGETDEMINHKMQSALKHELRPILCIGETLEEREAEQVFGVLEVQLEGGLSGISTALMENVVIAYEPVWAIGTGHTATPEQAQTVHRLIRDQLEIKFDKDVASKTRILYGGSAKLENAGELMSQADIDGLLVGGAGLNPLDFLGIVNF